jgi:hypothetical protein
VALGSISRRNDRKASTVSPNWRALAVRGKERQVQNRTPISLRFLVELPSVEAKERWRQRGRLERR